MITYLYWGVVIAVAMMVLFFMIGAKRLRIGFILSTLVLLVAWAAYFFHFQQVFVKRYGGVMSIAVPEGQMHMGATWKDENLWIENYEPASNTCHFNEYSKGNILQGKVAIKNCNPLMPSAINDESAAAVNR